MSANQPGADHKGEPPKGEKSADLAREKSPGLVPSDRISAASVRRRGAPFTTLGLAAAIALCALAFWHPEEVETFAINRLRDLSLAIGVDLPGIEHLEQAAPSEFAPLYDRLGIEPLPARLERQGGINQALARLNREPCDKQAIYSLGEGLVKAGERRIGANAYLGYAATCANGEGDKRRAADILLGLGDYDRTIKLTTELIAVNPANSAYRYLRGKALVDAKRYDEALTDYANTIELSDKRRDIGEWVFLEMSNIYAALKQYCSAITPIQTYVAIDPANRNTPKMRQLILEYGNQGNCDVRYAKGSDSFPHNGDNVIRAKVSVNGVDGSFILDTGASFVVLSSSFAARAKADVSGKSVPMETLNGTTDSTLGRAATIRVGRVEATDVPILIQNRSVGRDIDGVLGMSFLSRFDLSIEKRSWKLSQKK